MHGAHFWCAIIRGMPQVYLIIRDFNFFIITSIDRTVCVLYIVAMADEVALESAVHGFLVYCVLSCSACRVDRARNSRQHQKNVLPFALASGIVYTFLDLTSSVSLSEFELTMIVVSAWKYNMQSARACVQSAKSTSTVATPIIHVSNNSWY